MNIPTQNSKHVILGETTLDDNYYQEMAKEINGRFYNFLNNEITKIKEDFQNYYYVESSRALLNIINTGCAKYDNVYVVQIKLTTTSSSEKIIRSFIDNFTGQLNAFLNKRIERHIGIMKTNGVYGKRKVNVADWRSEVDYFFTKTIENSFMCYSGIVVINKDAVKVAINRTSIDHHETLKLVDNMLTNSWENINSKYRTDFNRIIIVDQYTCYGEEDEGYAQGHNSGLRARCVKQVFGNLVEFCCRKDKVTKADSKNIFQTQSRTEIDDYTFYEYCKLPLLYGHIPNNTEMFFHKTVPEAGYLRNTRTDFTFDTILNVDLLNNIERVRYITTLPIKVEEIKRMNLISLCNDSVITAERQWSMGSFRLKEQKVVKPQIKKTRGRKRRNFY